MRCSCWYLRWSAAWPCRRRPPRTGRPRHSLRAPVTGENFYFVMADRFENGSTANDHGGLRPATGSVSGFDPTAQGLLPRRRPRRACSNASTTSRASARPRSGSRRASRTRRSSSRTTSAGYHGYWITDFTQIDPHLGHQRGAARARRRRARARHEGLLRHHHQPHRGRHRLPRGPAPGVRLQGRVALPRPRPARRSTTATTPARTASRALDADDRASRSRRSTRRAASTLKVPAWLNDVTLYHNRGNTTFVGENSLLRRLLRPRRPLHRAPARRARDDRHLQDLDPRLRHRRLPDRHDEARQRRVLAGSSRPTSCDYARAQGKREFFMFGEVFDTTRPFTSHFTTHDQVQAVLDFPFQAAAAAASRRARRRPTTLRDFFAGDDWYTDADSNVYQLPTFLGNHDMGRIGLLHPRRRTPARPTPRCSPATALAHAADVPLARQPGRLLRRRAGLRRRRRRPARAPGHVPEPGRRSTTTTT